MFSGNIFRYQGIGEPVLIKALNHNKRELQKERGAKRHIDATKTSSNYSLHGDETPEQIERHARSLIALAGIKKLRKNVVMAIEVVYSLPIDWHKKDTRPFFKDCYQWTLTAFAGELLSFDVHLDESAPHAHALILPLVDNKMQGNKVKGDKSMIMKRRNSFHNEVASKHGLHNRSVTHLNSKDRARLAHEVMKKLEGDSVQDSAAYPWFRNKVYEDPTEIAEIVGAEILQIAPSPAQPKIKHFVDIARSEGKGSFIR